MKRMLIKLLPVVFLFALSQVVFSATYNVNKTTDSNDGVCDADCSLREAITLANGTPDNDIITFNLSMLGSSTINVTLGEIVVTGNGTLTIDGPGANALTIDGNMSGRILSLNLATVTINGLTFTGGTGVGTLNTGRGGAIYNAGSTTIINDSIITGNSGANGGGINNASTGTPAVGGNLTLNNCIVSNNTSTSSGGGLQNFSTSTLVINDSTFMGNNGGSTTGGGGAQINGTVRIANSTFANNTAPTGAGGGIQANGTNQIITNSTFSGNTSATNGGGIHRGTTNVNFFFRNNIVAGNNGTAASPDITNSANGISSEGNNLIGNVGTSTGWIMSDLLDTDPLLLPFADNGGFGMTFLPNTGSPAIDAGQNCVLDLTCSTNNPLNAITTDQRGVVRPSGSAVDIGAVEVSVMAANVMISGRVTTSEGQGINGAVLSISDGKGVIQVIRANNFGYFNFNDILSGQTYTINTDSKGYTFDPLEVMVNNDISGLIISPSDNIVFDYKRK